MKRVLSVGISGTAIGAVLAATAAVTALAYFTTSGNGESAPKEISKLAAPSVTATPAVGGTVSLTWGAISPPGPGVVTYSVSRNGGKAGGTCASSLAATTCTDSGLEPGVYEYMVIAKWSSWTATSSTKTAAVAVGAADHLALTAASSTPAAGAADNLTITAKDANNSTVTTYTGSKNLTFSGAVAIGANKPTVTDSSGAPAAFGTATSITFAEGVATVSSSKNGQMKIYASGTANISVSDGSISTKTPLEVTVSPLSASQFALTATSTTPTAGEVDNLTITARDAYGNVATSYTGSKSLTFSGATASPNGTVPTVADASGSNIAFGSVTAISFSAGVATADTGKNGAMKLYKSGSTSIQATDGTLLTTTALSVTVAATATRLALAAATKAPAAGAADNLTITAQDAYENTATGYAGSKSLTFAGAATIGTNKPTVVSSSGIATAFGTATAINFTAGVATVSSGQNGVMTIYASGTASISVSDGTISTKAPLEVTVSPLSASKFALAAKTATPAAGEADNLTVTAQDTYGNVATSYTGSKNLTYSGASPSPGGNTPTVSDSAGNNISLGTATPTTFSAGVASVSGTTNGVMKLYRVGAATINVTDGTLSGTLATTTTSTATKLLLTAATTTPAPGATDNLTITAQDTYLNTITTYTGSHNLTFSGATASPNGTIPTVSNSSGTATAFGSVTAISFAAGVASVSSTTNGAMKLYRAASVSLSVSDGSISSASLAITVSPGAASQWGFTNISVSAGTLSSPCIFTCTLTGLGNSGTVKAKVVVADTYGNTVSGLGTGHTAKVATNGSGSVSGTPLAIPSTGPAESATTFTFTSKASGSFSEIVTASTAEGTAYTAATITASK